MKKNININTKEAQDLSIILGSVDYVFNRLKNESSKGQAFDNEKLWKDLFSEKVILHIDNFLKELSEDSGFDYKTDSRIDDLREFIENNGI